MYAKLMPLVAEAGLDPRTTAIVAYGGAGPTHAFLLAAEVGIESVIVPPHPGTLCAMGCLVADVKSDFIRSVNVRLVRGADAGGSEILGGLQWLKGEADQWLAGEHHSSSSQQISYAGDLRYVGQAFTVEVSLDGITGDVGGVASELMERFDREYYDQYSVTNAEAQVDVVNLRATITAETPKPTVAEAAPREPWTPEPYDKRTVRIGGVDVEFPVYTRATFSGNEHFDGPAIVEQYDTTTFITGNFTVSVDPYLNLIGRRSQ
jgi:N-methylhydantoinase A